MQRSLINEFKTSNSTLFHSTVLGTTSLLQRKEGDLYKSRIAHLPADSQPRPDLSRKLDFVVVFQTIEIQRLSQELAGLRGRVRETEGRGLHQASYEVQIRELMERCSTLEAEKYSYREELAQTRAASENIFSQLTLLQGRYAEVDFCAAEKYKLEKARGEELVRQIQKWKTRYAALQRAKGEEQEGLRRLLESQAETVGNRQGKELLGRFEVEREELLARLRQRKEQLDERDLEIKKLQNCYQQLQVRSREDGAKVDSYEQKVAMLSQQTFRLNQLVRAKSEEIRNLKLMNEQDFSLKMSQIHSLDETRNFLSDKVRMLEDDNHQLREEIRELAEQNSHMKRKLVEVDRLEFQLREAREDAENKLRAMERKDKKIIALEEQNRQARKVEEDVKRLKTTNLKLAQDLDDLKRRLDSKIEQLRQVKEQQASFLRWREDFNQKLQAKLNEFSTAYQTLERQNSNIRIASEQSLQKSAIFELKAKEFSIQLKEKDYRITSLQNELRQAQAKGKTKEAESKEILQQLQNSLFAQRRNFQSRLKEIDARGKEGEQQLRQAEVKCRQAEARARQAQFKLKDLQQWELRVRSLQAECSDLDSWGRSLELKNHQLELHVQKLESHLEAVEQEGAGLREALQGQTEFYQQAEHRYYQSAQELRTLKARLDNIEKILITLKNTVGLRMRSAQEEDRRLRQIEQHYQQLFQWFASASSNYESGMQGSPSKQPYHTLFGSNENSRHSTSLQRSSLSPLHRARSSERTRENINYANNRQEPSIEAAIRHVLLCVQVESLRKRVGDKNAKVESMRNSIVTKGYGHGQNGGFLSSRDPSAGKKTTIYY